MSKVIKRILTVVLVIVLIAVVGIIGLFAFMDYRNKHYYKYANPYGEIEKTYTAMGEYEVSFEEYKTENKSYKKFEFGIRRR